MLKKILAGITAVLTLGCTNALNAVADDQMTAIENLDRFGYQSVVNVPVLNTDIDLSDTDPTHDENYIKYVENLESYGFKAVPELVEPFKSKYKFENPDIVNVYSKESGEPHCSYTIESVYKPFNTRITIAETNIDTNAIENEIRELLNNENASITTLDVSTHTSFGITFRDFSPKESYELSLNVTDMLSEKYTIESAVEYFGYRIFDDLTVEYNRFAKTEDTKYSEMSELTPEELENFNAKLSENGIKAQFETSTEKESYGIAVYDEGLTSAEIRENAEKIEEITGFHAIAVSNESVCPRYGLCVNFVAKYKVPDEIKERMREKQTEIPVVINYEKMSFYGIDSEYTREVNDYKKLMKRQSNYTAEEKQKLIENFKTETWNNLVSYKRESLVKRIAKKLGLSSDDIAYSIEESKISCCLSYEQIDDLAPSNYIESIRMIREGEDFDSENQAYYDKFSPVEGDANGDRNLSISDAVCILQYLANSEKYPISSYLAVNADISDTDGITAHDAAVIQQIDAATR